MHWSKHLSSICFVLMRTNKDICYKIVFIYHVYLNQIVLTGWLPEKYVIIIFRNTHQILFNNFWFARTSIKTTKNIKMQFPDIIRALWWQLASVCKFNCWKMTLKNSIKNTRHIFTLNDSFFTWIMSLMRWKNRQQLLKQHLLLHVLLLAVVVETNILLKYT